MDEKMNEQPQVLKCNLMKHIYIYSVLLICSMLLLFKGYGLITTTVNSFLFDKDIQFQEFIEREKTRYCLNMQNIENAEKKPDTSIFCSKLDDKQYKEEQNKFWRKEKYRMKKDFVYNMSHVLFVLLFAIIHLMILRKSNF